MNKKKTIVPAIRSSAAEYLTFVAASGQDGVEAVYADEDVWLSQKMMSVLYDVETNTINYHLKKVFSDNELEEDSVIRNFRITAKDGKSYNAMHYVYFKKLSLLLRSLRALAAEFNPDLIALRLRFGIMIDMIEPTAFNGGISKSVNYLKSFLKHVFCSQAFSIAGAAARQNRHRFSRRA